MIVESLGPDADGVVLLSLLSNGHAANTSAPAKAAPKALNLLLITPPDRLRRRLGMTSVRPAWLRRAADERDGLFVFVTSEYERRVLSRNCRPVHDAEGYETNNLMISARAD
jgi:hypothetical protein